MTVLGDLIAEVRPGFACGKQDPNGIFQFRMNNVSKTSYITLDKRRRIPIDAHRKMSEFKVRAGDVLFNTTNSPDGVGKAIVVPPLDEPAVFSNHFLRLRPDADRLDASYLWRWLQLQFQRGVFQSMCRQWVNQATISQENLFALDIDVPALERQRRIAAILDQADGLRAKRRQVLAHLDTLAQSIFLQMFGDPAVNPHRYPIVTVGSLASKFSDGPFGSNLKSSHYTRTGIPVVRLQNIGVGRYLAGDRAFVSEEHYAALRKHDCMPGDVLIGTLGDPNLRACIQPDTMPVALNKADCIQMRVDSSKALAEFVCWLLNMPGTVALASSLVLGQTRSRISMGRLRNLEVPVPPLDRQAEFAARVARVKTFEIEAQSNALLADELFASLQSRAFRGEL